MYNGVVVVCVYREIVILFILSDPTTTDIYTSRDERRERRERERGARERERERERERQRVSE